MPNKTALTNPLPLRSRSWNVMRNLNLNRRHAPSNGRQAFDDGAAVPRKCISNDD